MKQKEFPKFRSLAAINPPTPIKSCARRWQAFAPGSLGRGLLRRPAVKLEEPVTPLILASLVMTIITGCSQSATSVDAQAANVELAQSKSCTIIDPPGSAGGYIAPATVTMNNDGGWCSYLRWTTSGGRVFGAPMHVTEAPKHGEIDITVQQKGTRVSYKPTPGFAGADHFRVVNDILNFDRPYEVTVTP